MQRFTSNLRALSLRIEAFNGGALNWQSVRWARKPIWLGTAKSKLYRVPPRIELPEAEREEIKRLYNNYRTTIKSLRRFLTYKHSVLLQAKADTELIRKEFEQDFIRCKEINDQWNAEVKILREERLAHELEQEINYAKQRVEQQFILEQEILREAEALVKREKEEAKNFITPEKLDEAIEKVLNNPVDHNFAIDLEGNVLTVENKKTGLKQ